MRAKKKWNWEEANALHTVFFRDYIFMVGVEKLFDGHILNKFKEKVIVLFFNSHWFVLFYLIK
jgi:hypothetical protein